MEGQNNKLLDQDSGIISPEVLPSQAKAEVEPSLDTSQPLPGEQKEPNRFFSLPPKTPTATPAPMTEALSPVGPPASKEQPKLDVPDLLRATNLDTEAILNLQASVANDTPESG